MRAGLFRSSALIAVLYLLPVYLFILSIFSWFDLLFGIFFYFLTISVLHLCVEKRSQGRATPMDYHATWSVRHLRYVNYNLKITTMTNYFLRPKGFARYVIFIVLKNSLLLFFLKLHDWWVSQNKYICEIALNKYNQILRTQFGWIDLTMEESNAFWLRETELLILNQKYSSKSGFYNQELLSLPIRVWFAVSLNQPDFLLRVAVNCK